MHRSPAPVFIAAFILGAAYFFAIWLLLPANLSKSETRLATVSAEYVKAKTGRAKLTEPDGRVAVISCGRVRDLCVELQKASIRALTVWLQEPILGAEPWVAAAEFQSHELLPAWQQSVLYSEFREKNAILASTLFALAATVLLFTYLLGRRSAHNAA